MGKDKLVKIFESLRKNASSMLPPSLLPFLTQDELLRLCERITADIPNKIYDRAIDGIYNKTHIGGGNHRLLDGSHDLFGAWEAVKEASVDDGFTQEVLGTAIGLLKDFSTFKGLPFMTVSPESYEKWQSFVSNLNVPGVSKEYAYDFLSFDALEAVNTAFGVACVIFAIRKEDRAKLWEILGSLGIVGLATANLPMVLVTIVAVVYAYKKKKTEKMGFKFVKGGASAGFSLALFKLLGFHILIELFLVIVFLFLLKKIAINKDVIFRVFTDLISKVTSFRKSTNNT